MSQQIQNQQTIRAEIAEIIESITLDYEGALDYWKTEHGNPYNYTNEGIDKYDFETMHSEGSELKEKTDRLVQLAKVLEFKNIDGTNQEFEGRVLSQFARDEMNPHRDGSVNVPQEEGDHSANEFDRNQITYDADDWRQFVKRVYELGSLHSNNTGSSHLHMSVKTQSMYSTMTNKLFFDTLCNFLYVFGKMYKTTNTEFYNRLCGIAPNHSDGSSYWCKSKFDEESCREGIEADYKISGSGDDGHHRRYRYVNYCHGLHSTIEIRGLPHFKSCKTMTDFDNVIFAFVETLIDRFFEENQSLKKIKLHAAKKQIRVDRSYADIQEYVI